MLNHSICRMRIGLDGYFLLRLEIFSVYILGIRFDGPMGGVCLTDWRFRFDRHLADGD